MAGAYYNEIDPFAAAWLRELIRADLIAPGEVDTRDIQDVAPSDLRGFTQCHFFAGIGVWSYAARLAGWPDDHPLWTGSAPCQPFSAAGKAKGFDDERHLWPAWHWLIQECRPPVVVGEQVASKHADAWLDLVSFDLEDLDFAFGAVAGPAAGFGAPMLRDRTYWVAARGADHPGRARLEGQRGGYQAEGGHRETEIRPVAEASEPSGVAGADGGQFHGVAVIRGPERDGPDAGRSQGSGESEPRGDVCGRLPAGAGEDATIRPGPVNGFWRDADWLACRDGKWRPVEPGTFPLANGAPARVGRLRGYGNAIAAPQAAEFLRIVWSLIH